MSRKETIKNVVTSVEEKKMNKSYGIRSAKSTGYNSHASVAFMKDYDVFYREIDVNSKEVRFWKAYDANRKTKKVHLIRSAGNTAINLSDTFLKNKHVFIRETEDAFIFTEATKEPKDDKIPGIDYNVSKRRDLILTDAQRKFLNCGKSFQKITFYCSPKIGFYVEIEKVNKEIPDESCGLRGINSKLKLKGIATAYMRPKDPIKVPPFFVKESGIEIFTTIPSEIRGNKVVFTAKDGVCAICERPVKKDRPIKIMKVCKCCSENNSLAGEVLKKNGYDYEALRAIVKKIG